MKQKTQYVCSNCGSVSLKWIGRCPDCDKWNTFQEETIIPQSSSINNSLLAQGSKPEKIQEIDTAEHQRIKTGSEELDRVLGGGIVPGSVILVGGPPGIGKSTLLLQVSNGVSKFGKVLYVSGEESSKQIKMRADRLHINPENLYVMSEVNLDEILNQCNLDKYSLIILDSIQTVFRPGTESAPGSVSQVRECTSALVRMAKMADSALIIVGHVTKEGNIAGPRVLEHLVDSVIYFEGEHIQNFRIIKPVKNRFGSTDEAGIFEMTATGLKSIQNPSSYFLTGRTTSTSGSAIIPVIEGSRAILVELQALVTKSWFGIPNRKTNGFDINRLSLILAVIEKRAGLQISSNDIYVNAVAGMEITEPAADLTAATAIISSYTDKTLGVESAIFGEIGLGGEIRGVSFAEKRIAEAERLGFKKIFIPKQNESAISSYRNSSRNNPIKIVTLSTVKDLVYSIGKD